jgi:hypothetical protein
MNKLIHWLIFLMSWSLHSTHINKMFLQWTACCHFSITQLKPLKVQVLAWVSAINILIIVNLGAESKGK